MSIISLNVHGGCREKVTVRANKTNLIFQGLGYLNTSIAWNDTANSTGGTIYSSTVSIFADNFIAYDISFQVTMLRQTKPTNSIRIEVTDMAGGRFCFFRKEYSSCTGPW